MEFKIHLSPKVIFRDILLCVLPSFFICFLSSVLIAKFNLINGFSGNNFLIFLIVTIIILSLIIAFTSRNKFITSITCETKELTIKTALGRIRRINLSDHSLDIQYYIDSDTNQLKDRKVVIFNSDRKEIGYLFDIIPDYIFVQIASFYKLDTTPFNQREIKQLPLNSQQKDSRYIQAGTLLFLSFLLIPEGWVLITEKGMMEIGIISLMSGTVTIIVSIYILTSVKKR